MRSKTSQKLGLISALTLAGWSTAPAQNKVPNFAGSWMELNVNPQKAMKLEITQTGSGATETTFGKFTIIHGVARGGPVQQCAPPFRQPGYDYDAHPSVAVITMRLNGATLRFDRDLHWNAPCGGHPVGVEHDTHLFQRYP